MSEIKLRLNYIFMPHYTENDYFMRSCQVILFM